MEFILSHLDWWLSITTLLVLWWTGKKSLLAPIGGMANNFLWIGYAIYIHQYGLIALSVGMLFMYTRMLYLWMQEPQVKKVTTCPHGFEDWDDCPDCCH